MTTPANPEATKPTFLQIITFVIVILAILASAVYKNLDIESDSITKQKHEEIHEYSNVSQTKLSLKKGMTQAVFNLCTLKKRNSCIDERQVLMNFKYREIIFGVTLGAHHNMHFIKSFDELDEVDKKAFIKFCKIADRYPCPALPEP